MNLLRHERRSFIFGLGNLGFSRLLSQRATRARAVAPHGYVLGDTEGEQLEHFRDHGRIVSRSAPLRAPTTSPLGRSK